MTLRVVGVSFKTADIGLRECFSMDIQSANTLGHQLLSKNWVRELVILSTCHRTEIYYEGETLIDLPDIMVGRLTLEQLQSPTAFYAYEGEKAVRHLMSVASGLDSMVVGEVEILGQVKKAYQAALDAQCVGKYLDRLFQKVFSVTKRIKTETDISVNPVSLAYLGASLSKHIFSDVSKTRVLLLGAGDLIRLMAQHLKALGVCQMQIASRTERTAKMLAESLNAEYFALETIRDRLHEADIVVTGCTTTLPLIGKGMVEHALRQRKHKPMLMIDFSVPRNIECDVQKLADVYLYCVDDLAQMAKDNQTARQEASKLAEVMIQNAATEFMQWLEAEDDFKMLSTFRETFEEMRDSVLKDALHRLQLGELPEKVVTRMANDLTNRFLHKPTRRLRAASLSKEKALLTLTQDLFELNRETVYTE